MSNIEKTETCWLWKKSKDSCGYGQFYLNGKVRRSHRISYELYKGEIPQGLQLDHLCRVRHCCNPEHLEVVTNQENSVRGLGGYHNKIKTHCPRGHEYSGNNLRVYRNYRHCRTCAKEYKLTHKT